MSPFACDSFPVRSWCCITCLEITSGTSLWFPPCRSKTGHPVISPGVSLRRVRPTSSPEPNSATIQVWVLSAVVRVCLKPTRISGRPMFALLTFGQVLNKALESTTKSQRHITGRSCACCKTQRLCEKCTEAKRAKNVKSALCYQVQECAAIVPRTWNSDRQRKNSEVHRACDDNDERFKTESRSQEWVLMVGSTSRQTEELLTERCSAERVTFSISGETVSPHFARHVSHQATATTEPHKETAAETQTVLPLQLKTRTRHTHDQDNQSDT